MRPPKDEPTLLREKAIPKAIRERLERLNRESTRKVVPARSSRNKGPKKRRGDVE